MKRVVQFQFMSALMVVLLAAVPASAQPLLQWNFDESGTGSQDALDGGLAPAEDGIFKGGATRSSNTPGGASTGSADLVVGTDGHIQASDTDNLENLSAITITAWINLQADPVGNDRIAALQAGGTPPNADFNDNGTVDATDFLIWQQHANTDDGSALNADGDANADGNVLGDDLSLWQVQNGGPPGPTEGQFNGFSLNINAPNDGDLAANDFKLGMFIGGLDFDGDPAFDFGQSTVDIEGTGGSWIFIATTFDGATGDLLFVTGSETASASQLGASFSLLPVEIERSGVNFYVGKTDAATGANTSLEGLIDDVRVYDSALDLAALEAVRLENLAAPLTGVSSVPEPSTFMLCALVAIGGMVTRRRKS